MTAEEIFAVAEIVGGAPMRQLVEFYLTGNLPEGASVQTICEQLSADADTRIALIDVIHAASEKNLEGWAQSQGSSAAHRLSKLREQNFRAFVERIRASVEQHGSVAAAARALGVSKAQMFRYMRDVRESEGAER